MTLSGTSSLTSILFTFLIVIKHISVQYSSMGVDYLLYIKGAFPVNELTDQQFEEPETWFVVAGLEGVDEEEHHEAIKDERVGLHGDVSVLRVETGEDAETPQHAQETSNLQHRKEKMALKESSFDTRSPLTQKSE